MTDYSKNVDYAAKDALATGDPVKRVLGTEIDAEFAELVTAVASKYDSSDIASIAEAQAMVSNTVLITPARLGSALAGTGAGALADILALTDPGADRILFWDDSADAVAWLSIASSLAITGTSLAVVPGSVDHNLLLNYVADQHVAHSGVSINTAATSGLAGGGTIAATRTLSLDINGLTTDNAVDTAADYLPYYDTSEGAANKVLMSTIVGTALGDGAWYLSADQAVGTAVQTTLVFNTAEYTNTLTRGTFSTSTGLYTAGASGARVLVTLVLAVTSLASARSMVGSIFQNTTEKKRATFTSIGGTSTTPTVTVVVQLALASGDTVKATGYHSAGGSAAGTILYTGLTITELA
jgi:hypothetical protein